MRQSTPLPVLQLPANLIQARNTSRPVMLIGFQNQGNLGLGYLAAVLRKVGYTVHVVDIEQEPEKILEIALRRPGTHWVFTDFSVFHRSIRRTLIFIPREWDHLSLHNGWTLSESKL